MGARILRIELRRSVALLAALLVAVAGVVVFTTEQPYESWMELVISQREILQLTWALALAAGAWQGIRERRSRIEELLATTPRPRRQRVLPVAAAMAIGAVAAYLVMLAGGAGRLRRVHAYFPTGAVPLIALGALALVAAVWLGLVVGTLLPSPLTAPVLAVVGFVGLGFSPMLVRGEPGSLLLFPYLQGPRNGGYDLQMLTTRANLSQALWLAALTATALALFAAARPRTRVAALVPAVLGAAIAVPAMPRHLAAAWVEDRRATEVICTRDEPRVCIPRVDSYALGSLRGPAREALSVLAAKLPPAPTRVLVDYERTGVVEDPGESPPERPQPTDTLLVPGVPEVPADPPGPLWMMLDGAGVRPCEKFLGEQEKVNARYLAGRLVAAAWLLDQDLPPADEGPANEGLASEGEDPVMALAIEALATLRALPAGEQRARVTALRDAERTCAEGDRLDLLSGHSR